MTGQSMAGDEMIGGTGTRGATAGEVTTGEATPDRSRAWSEFPPHVLREYALLADGHRGALVGPRGDIAWLCAPRWDSDAVMSALIGGEGLYAVTPQAPSVWGGYYEPGTLVWHSRWVARDGQRMQSREALVYPGDPHRVVVLRRLSAGERDARFVVVLDARAGFGQRPMRDLHRDDVGVWTARSGDLTIRWHGAPAAGPDRDGRLRAIVAVPAGGHHDLVLEIGDRPLPDPVDPDRAWQATLSAWRGAVPQLATSVAPRDARHAYAVLQGLTGPGGMVAAATLGLPERIDAGRNYDYRYMWLRDQSYAGVAAAVDQPHPLLDTAVQVATARLLEHGDRIAPAYRADGSALPRESTLPLPGYPGGAAVVGNWVTGQFQLDTLGEILHLLGTAARHDHLDADGHRAMRLAVDVVEARWTQPEAGIWELDDDWWSQSRLSCVAGLHTAAAQLPTSEAARLTDLAAAILAETSRRCLGPGGAWQRSPQRPGFDASMLLPPVRGALPADDPRTVATLQAVERDLAHDGYVYRYRPDDRPLGSTEGAFVLCGFFMALAQSHQGRLTDAFRWFERNRSACGPPGLMAEEFDVRQRQLRGNLPQAFAHALLLETAQRLTTSPDRWNPRSDG